MPKHKRQAETIMVPECTEIKKEPSVPGMNRTFLNGVQCGSPLLGFLVSPFFPLPPSFSLSPTPIHHTHTSSAHESLSAFLNGLKPHEPK